MSALQRRVDELESENARLRAQLSKAKRFAKLITSLGADESEEDASGDEKAQHGGGRGGGSGGSSPRLQGHKGVSFGGGGGGGDGEGRGRRSSMAVVKNDATQWESYIEPTTGDEYWFNKTLKVTVWEKPDCLVEAEAESDESSNRSSNSSSNSSRGGKAKAKSKAHTNKGKPQHGRLRSSSFVVRERAEEEHDASKWEERFDEHGKRFWYHRGLKTTSHKMPAVLAGHDQDEESTSALSASEASAANDWVRYEGKKSGEPYWQHKQTKQIVWTDPTGGAASPPHSQEAHGHDLEEENKPSNWKRMTDKSSGDFYYVFLPTRATQWECPPCFGGL